MQVFVDGLTLLQTGDGAVLPVDGAHIGYHALQCLVTAHQCFIAQLQTLVQQFPELLLISFCQNTDLGKVDADNALIEAAFPLVLSVFILPGRQEGTAAHAGKYIALVVLTHLLGRDIVGVHSLSGALCGQFGHIVVFFRPLSSYFHPIHRPTSGKQESHRRPSHSWSPQSADAGSP